MNKFIVLLRGINVGGKRKLPMQELRELCESLGYSNISTYIQSGNVVLEADATAAALAEQLQQAILREYDFEVPVVVLSAEEFLQAYHSNPYLPAEPTDKLHLSFLHDAPTPEVAEKFKESTAAANSLTADNCSLHKQLVYVSCEGSYHKGKYSNNYLEKQLKVSATTRKWKTVQRLVDMVEK